MKYYLCLWSLLLSGLCYGQKFEAQVSSDSILLGNKLELTFVIENMEGQFEGPPLDGFILISGPNQSSSIQIINGDKTVSASYSYYLRPEEVGTMTIPPAYLVTEDLTLETLPIEINVYPNPENIITEPDTRNSEHFFFDFFGNSPKLPDTDASEPKRKLKKL